MATKKDYKLLFVLILWKLIPSICLPIRLNIIDRVGVNIDILGQLEWFDLIDEVIITALTIPLYFLLRPGKTTKKRNGATLAISFTVYFIFVLIMSLFIGDIAKFMNAEYAIKYLFLQNISFLIGFITTFMVMLFTINNKNKMIRTIVILKVIFLITFDILFIPRFKDIGAPLSEIVINLLIAVIALIIGFKNNLIAFGKTKLDFIKIWAKKGISSGISMTLENLAYALMICKLINGMSQSGNYWIANNFIWGWLLIPAICVTEIIKKNNFRKLNMRNAWRYAIGIALFWIITIPFWNAFIDKALASDPEAILSIVFPLIPFYMIYIIAEFINAWFVQKGRTNYLTTISLIVNVYYYGCVYILIKQDIIAINLISVIFILGFGMVIRSIISIIFYYIENRITKTKNVLIQQMS